MCIRDRSRAAVDDVPVDVHILEVVVRSNLLNLTKSRLQRTPVPEPDIVDGRRMCRRIEYGVRFPGNKRNLFDVIQTKRLAREFNIVLDVWRLFDELVGANNERGNIS